MAADIPPHLMTDILIRLPVRDLLRFRSVSKSWCSLIDSQDFITKHLEHALRTASDLGVVIGERYFYEAIETPKAVECLRIATREISELSWLYLNMLDSFENIDVIWERDLHWMNLDKPHLVKKIYQPIEYGREIKLLGSCNGLLAISNSREDVALWNPTTRRYRKLPNSKIEFRPLNLIFGYIIYGFGHDRIGDDYKLVRLVQVHGDTMDSFKSEVKVYSAKTDSWKRIRDCPYYLRYKRESGVLFGDALHWVGLRKPRCYSTKFIAAFDLATEEYREVPMPRVVSQQDIRLNVKVLGGFLCLLFNYLKDDPRADWINQSERVEVWAMKDYGVEDSWIKLFSVVPTNVIGSFSFISPIAYLSTFRNGRQILLNKSGKKFITYDLATERADDAEIFSTLYVMEMAVCAESLVRLDCGVGQNRWKEVEEQISRKRGKEKQN